MWQRQGPGLLCWAEATLLALLLTAHPDSVLGQGVRGGEPAVLLSPPFGLQKTGRLLPGSRRSDGEPPPRSTGLAATSSQKAAGCGHEAVVPRPHSCPQHVV